MGRRQAWASPHSWWCQGLAAPLSACVAKTETGVGCFSDNGWDWWEILVAPDGTAYTLAEDIDHLRLRDIR